ncbi:hypothetical protein Pfo_004125 [Paulownia fortunei]|nr:hypothetical protein Pfo_004125 [Paulownia fortunei]
MSPLMPQVDLETLVSACAGNDRKITCETLAEGGADDDPTKNDVVPDGHAAVDVEPDFPPESFWLSKDAEYDWFDRNALYERKESTKGNSNSTNLNPSINPSANSNSQRSSVNLKSKASIIGLPKTQKTTFVDTKRRTCKPANTRLFPKRSETVGKSTVPVAEPGSPKVSCMGRVRSKRCRRRSNSLKRKEKPMEKLRSGGEKQKTGFCSKVMSMFRSKKGHRKPSRSGSRKVVEVSEEEPVVVEPRRKSVTLKVREIPVGGETMTEPPGLGGMKRFASGRRSGSWAAEDFNQAISGSLESDRHVGRMSTS